MTFDDLALIYERQCRGRGVTRSQYVTLKSLVKFFGHMKVKDIDYFDVEAYGRFRQHVRPGTLRRELGVLKACLTFGVDVGALPKLPRIDLPPEGSPRTVTLTKQQADDLLQLAEAHSARMGLFTLLALDTGARRGAIETLCWSQVDLEQRMIDYRVMHRRVSRKRRAVVPTTTRLNVRLAMAKAVRDPNNPYVLGSGIDLLAQFKNMVAGTPYAGIRPHDLRRTFATLRAQAGVSLWDVAALLGDSIQTVQKHYAHHSPEHLRAAVEAV